MAIAGTESGAGSRPGVEDPVEPDAVARPDPSAAGDSLWQNRDFLTFWAGETLSLYGTQVSNLALPLTAVLVFNASPQQVGLLRFLQLVPFLALALVFGVWVDRMRRKPIMIAANVARMLLVGLIPLLSHYHRLSITGLLVIACSVGICSVLFDVSWMSFVPSLVRDPARYVEANQKLSVTASSADVVGPGASGALVGWLTAPTALVVDAFSYLASLITLLLIRTPEAAPPRAAERHLGRELRDGARWVYGSRVLGPLAGVGFFCNFSMIIVWTMFLLYAVRDRQLSPALVGLVFSASSIGGLGGALISKNLIRRYRIGLVYGCAMTAIFTGPLLIPLAGGPRPVLVATFVLSFFVSYVGLGVSGVIMVSLRQTCTPQSMMGRMNAAFRTVLFGGGSLGGLCGGLVGGGIGLRAGLTVVALGSAAMVVPVLLSPVTRLREMPAAVLDPVSKPVAVDEAI